MGSGAEEREKRRGCWSLGDGCFGCGRGFCLARLRMMESDQKGVAGARGRLGSRQNRDLCFWSVSRVVG
jgi:hypothetical protein